MHGRVAVDILPVAPGPYRVRTEHGGLAAIRQDGLDGQGRYRIVLWPAPFAEVAVPTRYVDPRETP